MKRAIPCDGSLPMTPPMPDLTTCDQEPIHIPGSIQPHGILLVLSPLEFRVLAASENAVQHFGTSESLLGQRLGGLLDGESITALTAAEGDCQAYASRPLRIRLCGAVWRCVLHRSNQGLLLEAMLPQPSEELTAGDLFDRYEQATRRLREARDEASVCECVAREVRDMTGYDRVKVYRFARDGSGEVVAEANGDRLPSYLGLHFPASDIPRQAREMYQVNPQRQIPDINYVPVRLLQSGGAPIDLTQVGLRSVSPVHIEYLRNMAVGASMSISILRHGALWGLIACHHHDAHHVSPEMSQASVLLAQLVEWQLALLDEGEVLRRSAGVRAIETTLLQASTKGDDYRDVLLANSTALLSLMQASGLALARGTSLTTSGMVPSEDFLTDLRGWLSLRGPDVFETDHLGSVYPAAVGVSEAAGLLAVPLGGMPDNMMMWFRPEVARTVTWGGDPEKPVTLAPGGRGAAVRLSPRHSFAAWTQTVRGRARPWRGHEVTAAHGLRDMVADIIVRRSLELETINAQLTRTNEELEAFAYVASHDLKEPLRQIETFGTLLERTFKNRPPPNADPARWFLGIQASSRRLRVLIDDLAEYSRLGRHANPFAPCPLSEVVDEVKADLGVIIEATGAAIEVDALPIIVCDRTQMRQVLQNIVSNALKYRHPGRAPVVRIRAEIRLSPGGAERVRSHWMDMHISDNGIGIEARFSERIFQPFQRLHSADQYEGSGIGLAICRKILIRHGGTVSVTSSPGEGSVFTVSMPQRTVSVESGGEP